MNKGNGSIAPMDFDRRQSVRPFMKKAEKMPVMVVDNDRQILEMLSRFLSRQYNFKVTKACNAFEALNSLEGKNVRVVITDLQMPGMNGLTLASTIRKRYPEMIIILVTGVDREELEERQELKNIDLFIQKPFKMMTFLNEIHEIVNRI